MNLLMILPLLLAAEAAPTPTPTPPPISLLRGSEGRSQQPAPASSLAGIAGSIRLRVPAGETLVVNNQNIKRLSEGVELTTAQPYPDGGSKGRSSGDDVQRREAWQQRYQEARAEIRRWEAEVARLTGEVARLEQEFHARDDFAYRDGVIKPAWDKALADLAEARAELQRAAEGPEKVISEARKDGALPGWFRGLPEAGPTNRAIVLSTPTPR